MVYRCRYLSTNIFDRLKACETTQSDLYNLPDKVEQAVTKYFQRYGFITHVPPSLRMYDDTIMAIPTSYVHASPGKDKLPRVMAIDSSIIMPSKNKKRHLSFDASEDVLPPAVRKDSGLDTARSISPNNKLIAFKTEQITKIINFELLHNQKQTPVGNLKVTYTQSPAQQYGFKINQVDTNTHLLLDLLEQDKPINDADLVTLCCDCAEAELTLAKTLDSLPENDVKKSLGRRVLEAVMETGRTYSRRRLPDLIEVLKQTTALVKNEVNTKVIEIGKYIGLAKKMNADAQPGKITGALMMLAGVSLIIAAVVLGYFTGGTSMLFIFTGVPAALIVTGFTIWKLSHTQINKTMNKLAATAPPLSRKPIFSFCKKDKSLEPLPVASITTVVVPEPELSVASNLSPITVSKM
jgi:hypothetical protein